MEWFLHGVGNPLNQSTTVWFLRNGRQSDTRDQLLRSGGIAGMTYGQSNTGVSNSTLHGQRVAAAAASTPGGAGELDVALLLADGSERGRADPAFSAHDSPIGKWAEAVWESWLPRAALARLTRQAVEDLTGKTSPWRYVFGPAAAFVASAWRLGWHVLSSIRLQTDLGHELDLSRDPPAMIVHEVRVAVWRWRWRRLEANHPHLKQDDGGHGIMVEPIYRLLEARCSDEWGASQKAALRSASANRQWTQTRLQKAGLVDTPCCNLCVRAGLCDPQDDSPRHRGTLILRLLTCPATKHYRDRYAPKWITDLADRFSVGGGGLQLPPDVHALITRGFLRSPAPKIDAAPTAESFQWVQRPTGGVHAIGFADGSRLFADHDLYGYCARQGWALALYDGDNDLVASAKGRTPRWADGIHPTEVWALLQTAIVSDPACKLVTDC